MGYIHPCGQCGHEYDREPKVIQCPECGFDDHFVIPRRDVKYRGYTITYDPKATPIRTMDWNFVHEDYDWAPDDPDPRAGVGESVEACKQAIDEIEDE